MPSPSGSETPEETQKTKGKGLQPLGRLLPFLLQYRLMTAGAFGALLLAAIATLALPSAIRSMIDHGFNADQPQLIKTYFLALLGVVAILAVASALRYFLVMWIGERVVADLRTQVFSHLLTLDATFYDRARSGEILSRLTADTTQIKSAFGASASIAMRNLVMFIGAVIMMVVTSPSLSTMVLAAIPVIILPLLFFARTVRKRSRSAQDRLADAMAYAGEILSNIRTLQAFTHETRSVDRFSGDVETSFAAARHMTASRAVLTGFAILVIGSSVVGVLWIGANQVLSGTMSGGELSQFLLYSILAASSLAGLSEVWGELSHAAGAAERLSELLDLESPLQTKAQPASLPSHGIGDIRFDHVSYSYGVDNKVPTLQDLSFHIQAGERVAIVGPSGAGKSTLFHLLLRFYDTTAGEIFLNDIDLKDLSLASLRRHMALVPQDTAIFAGTFAENIAFARPGASSTEIEAAARAASAHEFIQASPGGYETEIGERGVTLSGGQRQRIAIARAILKDAPILLLDEATSALDAESEHLVQQALDGLMQGRTTLVIAHRLATVLKADRILVMDAGQLVEQGTHQELLARGGLYANLARLQFTQDDTPTL